MHELLSVHEQQGAAHVLNCLRMRKNLLLSFTDINIYSTLYYYKS